MLWFDRIYDLQYYNQPKSLPCYCEQVVFPADMQLQGQVYNGSGSYSLKLYVYSADGMVQYEDATTYFDYYFAAIPGSAVHFFNARLKTFSPAMCAHACYIVRAVVTMNGSSITLFDKYTERYCQTSCCDSATGIQIVQDGNISPAPIIGLPEIPFFLPAAPVVPVTECGDALIRIISAFDCLDAFTGDFYGIPDTVLSGSATFGYVKISNIRGRIVRRPREIKRELSYNCKLQRVESTVAYLLEGFEYFPTWKMQELEGQLHSSRIWVDDYRTYKEYQFSGGTPLKQISKCFELFKLETVLEVCTQRQVFGCGADCTVAIGIDGSNLVYSIPESYNGGAFFGENKQMVAQDYDELLVYLRAQDGITDVHDIDISSIDCTIYKAIAISGNGYIPGSIYYDAATGNNRVFGAVVKELEDMCNGVLSCSKPVTGIILIDDMLCQEPETGTPVVTDITGDAVGITGYGSWVIDPPETYASLYMHQVTFSIKSVNSTITADPDYPEEGVYVANAVIGVIGSAGCPAVPVILDSNNNGGVLADEQTIMIHPNGFIAYTGRLMAATETDVTAQFDNLVYSLV